MSDHSAQISQLHEDQRSDFNGHLVGEITSIDSEGVAFVTFPGSHGVAVRARSVVDTPARAGEQPDSVVGARALLAFENADPKLPIVLGLVREPLRPEPVREEVRLDISGDRDVVVDGQRLVFDAKQEVLLRCGKSTILMRRDGKVLVRGTDLVSRSSGANRIKGGTINLN